MSFYSVRICQVRRFTSFISVIKPRTSGVPWDNYTFFVPSVLLTGVYNSQVILQLHPGYRKLEEDEEVIKVKSKLSSKQASKLATKSMQVARY